MNGHSFVVINPGVDECKECGKSRASRVHRRATRRKVAPRSSEFTPRGSFRSRYMLDDIPSPFWREVRARAAREGVSMRALILSLLTEWNAR